LADLAAPEPTIPRAFAAATRSLGQNLAADTAMRERIDRAIDMAIEIIPWRGKLAQFISDVVRQWDTRSFTERLELAVGRVSNTSALPGRWWAVLSAVSCTSYRPHWSDASDLLSHRKMAGTNCSGQV
jgi:hypothetical protein